MMQPPVVPPGRERLATYEDALRFLDGLDVSAMKLGLERVQCVLERLDNPQDQLPVVHIAGTNGKGSVTAMVSGILKQAGYRVGTFTSPHLIHVRERLAINGNPILPDEFQFEVERLRDRLTAWGWPREDWPTYFEFLTVMAYQYFLRQEVDLAVFETGLGGRLDATNVVKRPHVTIITGISLDHTQHLGNTLAQIAGEKAGILKEGVPVVLGPNLPDEALHVIVERALALDCPIHRSTGASFEVNPASSAQTGLMVENAQGARYTLSLLGPYQRHNLATVLTAVQVLQAQGWSIPESAVQSGLAHTYWPGRFQYVPGEHLLVDGSHNAEGFVALLEGIRLYFPNRPLHWLISLRRNRAPDDLLHVMAQCPNTRSITVTRTQPEHLYHPVEDLLAQAEARFPGISINGCPTPTDALARLREQIAGDPAADALGIVTGSLYTAGEILHCLEHHPR